MLGSSSGLFLLQLSAIILGFASAAPISVRETTISEDALARVLLTQPTTITLSNTLQT